VGLRSSLAMCSGFPKLGDETCYDCYRDVVVRSPKPIRLAKTAVLVVRGLQILVSLSATRISGLGRRSAIIIITIIYSFNTVDIRNFYKRLKATITTFKNSLGLNIMQIVS